MSGRDKVKLRSLNSDGPEFKLFPRQRLGWPCPSRHWVLSLKTLIRLLHRPRSGHPCHSLPPPPHPRPSNLGETLFACLPNRSLSPYPRPSSSPRISPRRSVQSPLRRPPTSQARRTTAGCKTKSRWPSRAVGPATCRPKQNPLHTSRHL